MYVYLFDIAKQFALTIIIIEMREEHLWPGNIKSASIFDLSRSGNRISISHALFNHSR